MVVSPFAEWEREAGARMGVRLGVELPEDYGDPRGEYEEARGGVGLVDASFRGLLRLTGSERLRWLNGQITNDVKALGEGAGLLAAFLTAKGHVVADLAVYGFEDSVWIDLPRERTAVVCDALEHHIIADDVAVEPVSDQFAHLMVVGPGAAEMLASLGVAEAGMLSPWSHAAGRIGNVSLQVVATRWLARAGLDLFVPASAAAAVWEELVGRERLRPVGMAALEWLRVEAGWRWFGVDFDEQNLLMEALTADHVSLTKGCYVGQEVVIRIEHQGHVNKKICGLIVDGAGVPESGTVLYQGERKVGHITSAVLSPALGKVIALGYLHRDCWERGTRLQTAVSGTSVAAAVATLPLVEAHGSS